MIGLNLINLNNNSEHLESLIKYFKLLNNSFEPRLDTYIDIEKYAQKLLENAHVVILKDDDEFIGLYALYVNNFDEKIAYLSSIGVLEQFKGKQYSTRLIEDAISRAKITGMHQIKLEVMTKYDRAINFYKKFNFQLYSEDTNNPTTVYMYKDLTDG